MVELASSNELHHHPLHPYTISLLSAIPVPDPVKARQQKRIVLKAISPAPCARPAVARSTPLQPRHGDLPPQQPRLFWRWRRSTTWPAITFRRKKNAADIDVHKFTCYDNVTRGV
jgi:hypothetical protein